MRIFLCGGGDGEQTRMANQRLDQIVDHTKPLLYIPLAMEGNYESCQKWIQGELREVRVPAIEMVRSVEELFKKELEKYSAILWWRKYIQIAERFENEWMFWVKSKRILKMMELYSGGVPGRFFLDMILTVVQVWTKMRLGSWIQKDLMY